MGLLETLGILTIVYIVARLATLIYQLLSPVRIDVKKLGEWALVTGCTDGVGKAYALELAKRGLNVILISRTKEKLEQVAQEIYNRHSQTQVKIVVIDFTKDNSIYKKIREEIHGLDIGVLVNSASTAYEYPESFDKIEENDKFLTNIIRCNVNSVAHLTRMILPEMIKKRRGLIVNVSSIAGRLPTPLISLYSATKGFIDLFSRSLSAECVSRGVYVQSLCPGYVVKKLSDVPKASFVVPTPEKFVLSAIDRVTLPFSTGYWSHEIQDFIQLLLPEFVFNKIIMYILSGVRAEALEKRSKEQ